ncbi:ankyrin repeat domain-containing protein 16-like isoform X2 [Uloborus diversus]|uniref:ankyrin repeat domain-containing protein 16-like isoform X2 n=1 Tax=Uloborus diversus TaxID=327109 RepID=UPI00240A9353|nr:ankyrin repeat domain-containing protein 16-like isoform X2 [Uloborus diversus]
MIFNNFKISILDAVQSANFNKFYQIVSKYPEHSEKLNKVFLEKSGDNIVHLAAQTNCIDIIKYIYENGNKVLLIQKNLDGKSPLHIAAHCGHLNSVQFLLSCQVPVDPLKRADWTPLMLACTKNNADVVKVLVENGANLLLKNKDGWTAFHIASREGHIDVIKNLLLKNPNLWKTRSNNGRTPLHTASLHGHLDIVKLITSNSDCDNDVQDCCGTTPLMDAGSANHLLVVQFLIEQKASILKVDALGRNVLHLAAQSASLSCIQYLISQCGLNVNQQNSDGLTPLHFAAKENNSDCIKLLLKLNATPTIKDNKCRTVFGVMHKDW